ncbi:hypothetical protein B2A_06950, partial [mine drainage metagenome]
PDDVRNAASSPGRATRGRNLELRPTEGCVRCGGWVGQLGLEPTPELYVEHVATVFDQVRRVLRSDGTLWLNLGDTFHYRQSSPPFLLGGVPPDLGPGPDPQPGWEPEKRLS